MIKHICIVGLIERLFRKNKAFFYLDTHAGNGLYSLYNNANQDECAAFKLLDRADSANDTQAADYVGIYAAIISVFLNKNDYPGSPLVAEQAIHYFGEKRENFSTHNMHLNELHPSAHKELVNQFKHGDFHIHKRNGFELLNALLPPKPNRGLVLIDPPYEQASEYDDVEVNVRRAIKKWPQGIFAIWYPLLSPTRIDRTSKIEVTNPKHGLSEKMLASLSEEASSGMLDIRFAHCSPNAQTGMYGSGVAVINPPYQFDQDMQQVVKVLDALIRKDDNKASHVHYIVPLK